MNKTLKHYTTEKHPTFVYDEVIEVDMECFGYGAGDIRKGKVKGKSMSYIWDFWMIEFDEFFPEYPYKCLNVQHTFIVDRSEDVVETKQ